MSTKSTVSLIILEPESCSDCGLCCEGNGSPVLLYATRGGDPQPHPFRPAGLPEALVHEIDERLGGLFRGQEPEARCIWYDAERQCCRHYEWRPQVCRDFELGGPECIETRRPYVMRDRS